MTWAQIVQDGTSAGQSSSPYIIKTGQDHERLVLNLILGYNICNKIFQTNPKAKQIIQNTARVISYITKAMSRVQHEMSSGWCYRKITSDIQHLRMMKL